MRQLKRYLLGFLGGILLASTMAVAQEASSNSLESMTVARQGGVVNVRLTFKEPLTALPFGFSVAKPARIALDFLNTTNALGRNSQTYNEGDLRSVNVVQVEGRTRLVLNLNYAMTYETVLDGNTLVLALQSRVAKTWQEGGVESAIEHFSKAQPYQTTTSIRDIAFRRGENGEGRIAVDLSDMDAGIDIHQLGKDLVVDFSKVSIPDVLCKRLDVTDFGTPVLAVDTDRQGRNVRMSITPHGLWEYNAYQTDNQFVIEVKPIIEDPNKLVQGSRGGYKGEKLSLNFQNVDVCRLLQVIGEFTGMNMVVSDSVGGSITLILKDVPWDQALDIILQQKGLDMRKNGNVILVAPREEIATKEKLEFESKQQIGDLEPLRTESFQMNYVKGADVKKLLSDPKQTILSKRGSALLDDRSNILFVQDTPSRLEDVRAMIAKVDVPVRQVMIEARIVEAGDSFSKNIGMRLGYHDMNGGSTSHSVGVVGGGSLSDTGYHTGQAADVPTFPAGSSMVNLPASPRSGTAGVFSMILFNRSNTVF